MPDFEGKYKCENCGNVLGTHNGSYWMGLLLCRDCRAIAQTIEDKGKYDFTINGVPTCGA